MFTSMQGIATLEEVPHLTFGTERVLADERQFLRTGAAGGAIDPGQIEPVVIRMLEVADHVARRCGLAAAGGAREDEQSASPPPVRTSRPEPPTS